MGPQEHICQSTVAQFDITATSQCPPLVHGPTMPVARVPAMSKSGTGYNQPVTLYIIPSTECRLVEQICATNHIPMVPDGMET